MTEGVRNLWTIDELGTRVALALSVDYEGQASGRVRDIPDRRTIRYYTTLGLIDRPAEMRGRTALYGRRHLLQLVAIKRLQARGLTLAELQEKLVGQPDAALARLARVPDELDKTDSAGASPEPSGRGADFWRTAPAPVAQQSETPQSEANGTPAVVSLQSLRLDNDVALVLSSPCRPIEPDDIEAIRTVAAPLLKLLEKRRLLRPPQERRTP